MMFRFSKDQKVFKIGDVEIGGQPGEYPTVMVGSMFYEGQALVEDRKKGVFDEEKAREILHKEKEMSESTGLPRIIDVVSGNPEALIKYIDFIADETDSPFLLDGTSADVRIPAAKHVEEVGLTDRTIYNTISVDCKEEEIEVIKETGIDSAILLCYNPKKPTIEGRLESLEKTLEFAEKAKIKKKLVDPSVLDLPDPGPVSKTISMIKEEHGLPCGCGAHNAVDMWKDRREMDKETYNLRKAIANSFPLSMGADFALYGPLEDAKDAYNACSLTDAYVTYAMRMSEGIRPKVKDHPLNKIFRG